jgi:hypothetical protein
VSTDTPGRMALEAGTDQALAVARENRHASGSEDIAPLADFLAGIIAEQFPAGGALAGRVLMAAAQFVCATVDEVPEIDPAVIGTAMAFAAERIVREAGAS